MSFLSHLVDRIPEGIQRTEDTIIGLSLDLSQAIPAFQLAHPHRDFEPE